MAQINNLYSAQDGAYSQQPSTLQSSILPLITPNAYNRYPSGRPRFSDQPPGSNHLSATGKGILIGMLSAFGSAILIGIILVLVYLLGYTNRGRIFLDRIGRPGEYDDEQQFLKEETEALEQMDDIQRSEYLRAKAYIQANPPESSQTDISLSQFLAIQEKGVSAWEFEPEPEVANCFVMGRTEVEFFDSVCCVQTNLPVPKQNDVYYWEAKIYDMPETTNISIGFTTKPYPLFRLPGYHKTSVAYTSQGPRRFNQPFAPTAPYGPPYVVGDVIGVAYRPRTGTVFFTRNGRKLEDVTHHLKTQNLFPTLGATGPCKLHVNFGQMGFLFIEANVKKWGLAPMTGSLAPPPPYGSEAGSILLEGGLRGVREGEAWQYGSWAQSRGHLRIASQQMRPSRQQPRSPGPLRSPTDISLAQLSVVDDDEDPAEASDNGRSPTRSVQSYYSQYTDQPQPQEQNMVDFVEALQASEGLQRLNLPPGLFDAHFAAAAAQAEGPPPPQYESPPPEERSRQQGLAIDIPNNRRDSQAGTSIDEDATPRANWFIQRALNSIGRGKKSVHLEGDQRPLLASQQAEAASTSPPIPSYDAAVRGEGEGQR